MIDGMMDLIWEVMKFGEFLIMLLRVRILVFLNFGLVWLVICGSVLSRGIMIW